LDTQKPADLYAVRQADQFRRAAATLQLGEPEAASRKRLWPVIEPGNRAGLENFVAERLMPTVAKSFEAHGPFIHKTEKDHFQLLLCGGFDETYCAILPGHVASNTRSASPPAPG
jgi:hypothetical protein